jgi:8-hydroxy-5-deazaflavin:NADPH oxidoreductase
LLLYTPRDVLAREVLSDLTTTRGKVVVDCSNQQVSADLRFPAITFSRAEELAKQLPEARTVKAFNTLPQEGFELCPDAIRPYQVAVFVAADDTSARTTVLKLATDMGFRAIDAVFSTRPVCWRVPVI